MTSRRATGDPVRTNSIQIPVPVRSSTVASSALRRLGLRHVEEEEHDDYVVADIFAPPGRKRSQKEQDQEDEKARKHAMKNLVNSWQERLQLISVITTFFASIEAGMLVPLNTDPNKTGAPVNLIKAANAGLLGALIMHVYAAVLSFLGAFLLIRYKLKEATREEYFADITKGVRIVASPENGSFHVHDIETGGPQVDDAQTHEPEDSPQTHASDLRHATDIQHEPHLPRRMASEPPIFSRDPHLEQVGFWSPNISSHMLSRVHALCITLAGVGFILAIMGILLYAWALQTREVSIFVTVSLGAAIIATQGVLFLPD